MKYLKLISVLAVALGVTVSSASAAEVKLNFGHFMSPKHPMHRGVFVPLVKQVKEASNGEINIKIFDSGKLGKGPVQQYKRIKEGAFDLGFGVLVYTPTLFPKTMLASKPGVGGTAEAVARQIWNVYSAHLQDEFKEAKLLGLWANWPAVLISKKPIRTPADVKGQIVRTSSAFDAPQIKAWGGVPEQISVTQTYDAFQKGTVDAVFIAPAALYRPWNLHEPGNYVTVGMKSPASIFYLMANKDSWSKLSKKHQEVLEKATGQEFSINASKVWGKADAQAFEKLKTQKGIEVINLTADQAAAFDKLTDQVVNSEVDKAQAQGIPAREIFGKLTN